jgi:hypothetical protein
MVHRAWLLSLVLLATPALAQENETSRFFGSEADREYARLELVDQGPKPDQAVSIAVAGSGSLSVRFIEKETERRFALVVPKEDALALVKLALENDLVSLKIRDKDGAPDEHHLGLRLENALGQTLWVRRWASDEAPGFEKVESALRPLEKKCEGKEPVYQGKKDPLFRPFAGIEVTVSLSMNRPDPTFELVRPEDWEKVRTLTSELTAIDRPKDKDPPGKYRGFLLAPREIPALPKKWLGVQKAVIQIGDSPRDIVYAKDERGLEAWLLEEAKKRGIEIPR